MAMIILAPTGSIPPHHKPVLVPMASGDGDAGQSLWLCIQVLCVRGQWSLFVRALSYSVPRYIGTLSD